MSFTTFPFPVEDMKSNESVRTAWQGLPYSSGPLSSHPPPSYDLSTSSSLGPLYYGATGNANHAPPNSQQLSQEDIRQPASLPKPTLKSHRSYPSLKRSYQEFDEISSSETVPNQYDPVPDKDDQAKATIQTDHRLLSFGQTQPRHTILDLYGRQGNVEINAQIHGMFFLSEMVTNSGQAIIIQPELTCYRRNLFQISGSVTLPATPSSLLNDQGQQIPIASHEISISATESVDGHVIRLIVIPWKTPPPNSTEVHPNHEQEPPSISLTDSTEGGQELSNHATTHPISWRRLQFRVATANNGRRKELQQHFVLRLTVNSTLADGTKLCIAEAATAPIVVRGRSPRNFQARKEIPLVGSSTSTRGRTLSGTVSDKSAATAPEKIHFGEPKAAEQSKWPFQFDSGAFSTSPVLLRSGSFNQWSPLEQESEQGQDQMISKRAASQLVVPSHSIARHSSSEVMHMHASQMPQSLPPSSDSSKRSRAPQRASSGQTFPVQFAEGNPRTNKSPRHEIPPSHHDAPIYGSLEGRSGHSYNMLSHTSDQTLPSRNYFPDQIPPETWTTAETGNAMYTTSLTPSQQQQQHYTFHPPPFTKGESQSGHYTWDSA